MGEVLLCAVQGLDSGVGCEEEGLRMSNTTSPCSARPSGNAVEGVVFARNRRRVNMAHISHSRPDYGLGVQVDFQQKSCCPFARKRERKSPAMYPPREKRGSLVTISPKPESQTVVPRPQTFILKTETLHPQHKPETLLRQPNPFTVTSQPFPQPPQAKTRSPNPA